jgi:hypothetical protein
MNTIILDPGRRTRLAELDLEITMLRGKIRRTFTDAELLSRVGRGCEVELAEIAAERSRLQDALRNHEKERDELNHQGLRGTKTTFREADLS